MKSLFALAGVALLLLSLTAPAAQAANQSRIPHPGTDSAVRLVAKCVRCLAKCASCGRAEGSLCFKACKENGNPLVSADSACGGVFDGCRR